VNPFQSVKSVFKIWVPAVPVFAVIRTAAGAEEEWLEREMAGRLPRATRDSIKEK
jgi:hypothetical protein